MWLEWFLKALRCIKKTPIQHENRQFFRSYGLSQYQSRLFEMQFARTVHAHGLER